jgi:homoserine kinase type II
VAAFTTPDKAELTAFLAAMGVHKHDELRAIEGGSVNSNFSVCDDARRYFLRLYEEQGMAGAARELAMVAELARDGVATPTALGGVRELAGRPAALFPWVDGVIRCQSRVSVDDTHAVGRALAHLHVVGEHIDGSAGRFHPAALRARLDGIAVEASAAFPMARLRRTLGSLDARRDASVPHGLVHGDLFRDNVLWDGEKLVALLDFESASAGPFIYDLAVTLLAWCYGEGFSQDLARSLVGGYASVRPLGDKERKSFHVEACLAAVRFTITRITDYAMRPDGGARVMKDWHRFLDRLDALEAMGAEGLAALTGL